MRTKLFGAFIAALAIAAFAALPSAASAANVTLKEGALTVPVETTVRLHSTNVTITRRPSGRMIKCVRASIRAKVRTNPGARLTFRNEGVFQNAAGGDLCKVEGGGLPEGRITTRVENVTFRKDITLQKTGTAVSGRTEARVTFRLFDPTLGGEFPIASCSYDGTINVTNTVGSDTFHAESEEEARLDTEITNSESCDPTIDFKGDFRETRRDGTTPVKTN